MSKHGLEFTCLRECAFVSRCLPASSFFHANVCLLSQSDWVDLLWKLTVQWFQSAGNCFLFFGPDFQGVLFLWVQTETYIFISIMNLVFHLLLNFLKSSLFPLDVVLSFLLLVVFHSQFHSPRVKYALSFIFLSKFLISRDPLEVVTIRILCDA